MMRRDQGIDYAPKSQRAIDELKRLNQNTKQGIRLGMHDIGKQLKAIAKKFIIDPPKTGRISHDVEYSSTSGKNSGAPRIKKTHQASRKGESPANLSGRLYKSLNYEVHGSDSLSFGNSAPYAADLEFRMKRPYMKKSIDAAKKDIENLLQRRIITEITKGAPQE
jgi:hypothetical protein